MLLLCVSVCSGKKLWVFVFEVAACGCPTQRSTQWARASAAFPPAGLSRIFSQYSRSDPCPIPCVALTIESEVTFVLKFTPWQNVSLQPTSVTHLTFEVTLSLRCYLGGSRLNSHFLFGSGSCCYHCSMHETALRSHLEVRDYHLVRGRKFIFICEHD